MHHVMHHYRWPPHPLQVAAANEETFIEGYEEFLQENRPMLLECAARLNSK